MVILSLKRSFCLKNNWDFGANQTNPQVILIHLILCFISFCIFTEWQQKRIFCVISGAKMPDSSLKPQYFLQNRSFKTEISKKKWFSQWIRNYHLNYLILIIIFITLMIRLYCEYKVRFTDCFNSRNKSDCNNLWIIRVKISSVPSNFVSKSWISGLP